MKPKKSLAEYLSDLQEAEKMKQKSAERFEDAKVVLGNAHERFIAANRNYAAAKEALKNFLNEEGQ